LQASHWRRHRLIAPITQYDLQPRTVSTGEAFAGLSLSSNTLPVFSRRSSPRFSFLAQVLPPASSDVSNALPAQPVDATLYPRWKDGVYSV